MDDTQDKITSKDRAPQQPGTTPKALSALEAKRAQNLRDNLLKRKAQAKARSAETRSD